MQPPYLSAIPEYLRQIKSPFVNERGHMKRREKDNKKAGDDLLSRRRAPVPSAKKRFTSVFGMGTGISTSLWSPADYLEIQKIEYRVVGRESKGQYGQASRHISNGRLNMLPCLHRHPINQLVLLAPSVESSSMGHLILGWASRLDAFSGYPFRT
jgi:hypothetical protein